MKDADEFLKQTPAENRGMTGLPHGIQVNLGGTVHSLRFSISALKFIEQRLNLRISDLAREERLRDTPFRLRTFIQAGLLHEPNPPSWKWLRKHAIRNQEDVARLKPAVHEALALAFAHQTPKDGVLHG